MERNNKQRLFEVMGRLDKTFKSKLNEDFEGIEQSSDIELPNGDEEETNKIELPNGDEEESQEIEEKSPEEKLEELTAKVDELYAILHGESNDEEELNDEIPQDDLQESKKMDNDKDDHDDKYNDHDEDDKS